MNTNKVRKANIQKLYEIFYVDICSGRKDIIKATGITASPASDLIKIMLTDNLIIPVTGHGKEKYNFIV